MSTLTDPDKKLLKAITAPLWHATRTVSMGRGEPDPTDLQGYCNPASIIGADELNARGFLERKWKAVSGQFVGPTNRQRGHSWIIGENDEDKVLLDLTADQYDLPCPYYATWPDKNYSQNYSPIESYTKDITRSDLLPNLVRNRTRVWC